MKLRLKGKILTLALSACLIPLLIVTLLTANRATQALDEQTMHQLQSVRDNKVTAVKQVFSFMEGQFLAFSSNRRVLAMLEVLEADYGQNHAINTSTWKSESIANGAYLGKLNKVYGWHDIFLVNKEGVILWSVMKDADLGQSLGGDLLRNSSFNHVFTRMKADGGDHMFVSDFAPYGPANGSPAAFFVTPAKLHGKLIGYLAFEMPLDALSEVMENRSGMGKTGESFLVGEDHLMRTNSFLDPTNRSVRASFNNPSEGSINTVAVERAFEGKTGVDLLPDYRGEMALVAYAPVVYQNLKWVAIAKIDSHEAEMAATELEIMIGVVALVIAGAVLFGTLMFTRTLLRPVHRLTEAIQKIEKENDLTTRIEVQGNDEIAEIAHAMNGLLSKLQPTLTEIREGADSLASSSEELATTATEIKKTTEEVNQGIESSSAALNQSSVNVSQLAAAIREVASNAELIEGLAISATEGAQSGQEAMEETNSAINSIADSSKEIVKIINVITEIANQTNLLSLNAAIEAAKAGDSGKGFAVVAEEVRVLADRSNKSVEQIRSLIETSTRNVNKGIEVVQKTTDILADINGGVGEISTAISELNLAVVEQDRMAQEVNSAIEEINGVSEVNASAMNELSSAINQVNSTIEELSTMANSQQTQIGGFKL